MWAHSEECCFYSEPIISKEMIAIGKGDFRIVGDIFSKLGLCSQRKGEGQSEVVQNYPGLGLPE